MAQLRRTLGTREITFFAIACIIGTRWIATAAHAGPGAILLSSVTAPLRANALPDKVALVFSVMLVRATMLPMNEVVVPRVAEVPTCQNISHGEPPLMTFTDELLAVVSVLPI